MLHHVCLWGDLSLCLYLLRGARKEKDGGGRRRLVSKKDSLGNTALHYVCAIQIGERNVYKDNSEYVSTSLPPSSPCVSCISCHTRLPPCSSSALPLSSSSYTSLSSGPSTPSSPSYSSFSSASSSLICSCGCQHHSPLPAIHLFSSSPEQRRREKKRSSRTIGDEYPWMPFTSLTSGGYLEILELLVEMGCGLDDKNVFGQTPLHFACRFRNSVAAR